MDVFKNAETTVVGSYKTMKITGNPLQTMSDSAAGNSALREIKNKELLMETQQQIDDIEKEAKKKELTEGIINRQLFEAQTEYKMGSISKTCKEKLFKEILFETFYNSLLMDADFLEENKATIKGLTDKYVDDNGGYSILENSVIESGSLLLKKMKQKIDEITLEVCARKIKEGQETKDWDTIDFNLNEDEQEKLNYAKDELNVDKISELVKDKVLSVVKDEQEEQKKEAELIQNIENDLIEDDDVNDENSLNEALQSIILNKPVLEDSTLFNALLRASYHEYITENIAISSANHHEIIKKNKDAVEYDTDATSVDGDPEDTLSNGDTDPIDKTVANGNADNDDYPEEELNMDLVLTEAITKYTLMETLYTLKLENYSYENMQKLIHKLVN